MTEVNDNGFIRKLRERLWQKPDSKVFLSLAEELRKRDMVDQAFELLIAGVRKHPDFIAAQLTLGRWYLRSKKFAEAKEQFSAALEKDPGNRFVHKGLSEANRELGITAPEPGALAPMPPESMRLFGVQEADRFIAQGHYAQAMEVYQKMLAENSDDKQLLQRKEELTALMTFLGKDKENVVKKLNRFLEAIQIQFSPTA